MFYTIYKITNKINGKTYIGKHQTQDLNDGYVGSGKLIRAAIERYGIENFEKEILFRFDNEADMNAKEAELVTEDFVKEDTNYNLCVGGQGGFGYINSRGLGIANFKNKETAILAGKHSAIVQEKKAKEDKEWRLEYNRKLSISSMGKPGTFNGKKHSAETKTKMSGPRSHFSGSKNSQYGTMWITNGKENKKIKKNDDIPNEWYKGRTVN
jgi:hypothetical protein